MVLWGARALRYGSKSFMFQQDSGACPNIDQSDPAQMNNLLLSPSTYPHTYLGRPIPQVQARLDALLLVLKTCKADQCREPWNELHSGTRVRSLWDALHPRLDKYYDNIEKVSFTYCDPGFLLEAEQPVWNGFGGQDRASLTKRYGMDWAEWS